MTENVKRAAPAGRPLRKSVAASTTPSDSPCELPRQEKRRQRGGGGARARRKGDRIELELVHKHIDLGIHAERYPLSGSSRFRGSGHDIDLYIWGRDEAPAVAEVKGRKDGAGFTTLERWLGDYDALFLKRNNADPLACLPWRMWVRLLAKVRP